MNEEYLKLLREWEHLCWRCTLPRRGDDPTPSQIDAFRAPRLGPAWLALYDAIVRLADGAAPTNLETYLVNAIDRGIREAIAFDKHVFGPSPRTARRHKAAGIVVPCRDKWVRLESLAQLGEWTRARDDLANMNLSHLEQKVCDLLKEGHTRAETAAQLGIAPESVSRVISRIKAKAR